MINIKTVNKQKRLLHYMDFLCSPLFLKRFTRNNTGGKYYQSICVCFIRPIFQKNGLYEKKK